MTKMTLRNYCDVLGNDDRLTIIVTLKKRGELTLSDLAAKTGLSRSSITNHVKVLHESRFITSRKEGRITHYKLNVAPLNKIAEALTQIAEAAVDADDVHDEIMDNPSTVLDEEIQGSEHVSVAAEGPTDQESVEQVS